MGLVRETMRGLIISFIFLICSICFSAYSQPTVLGSDAFNYPAFSTYSLNTKGKLKQYRAVCNSSVAANTAKWLFCTGTGASPVYSPKWNPYTGTPSIPAFDSIIDPSISLGSARYNAATHAGNQGVDGYLPALVAGRYYTFNIGDLSNTDNYMAVWETTFNPVSIISTSQSPGTVCSNGDSITISVVCSSTPNAAEKVYVRYTRDSSFSPSYLVQLSFNGVNGTGKIPVLSAGDTIRYYVFSSKLSASQLSPSGNVSETYCDMSTLNMNNNSNNNFRFIIRSSPSPTVNFTAGAACVGVATSFVNNSTISSGSISSSDWNFGDASSSSVSGTSNINHTYSSTGTYSVILTATSALGCQKSSTQSVIVNTRPSTSGLLPH